MGGWDECGPSVWASSPEFYINEASALTWSWAGGASPVTAIFSPAEIPVDSLNGGGFAGIALRDVAADTYVLSKSRSSHHHGAHQTADAIFTSAELTPYLNDGKKYTLDFIDYNCGGWGWVNIDNVSLPGDTSPTAAGSAGIWTFTFPGLGDAVITNNNIMFTVPFGTDVSALAPTYVKSPLASCDRASGSTQNFAVPVQYVVTSQNSLNVQTYTVTVAIAKPSMFFDFNNGLQGWTRIYPTDPAQPILDGGRLGGGHDGGETRFARSPAFILNSGADLSPLRFSLDGGASPLTTLSPSPVEATDPLGNPVQLMPSTIPEAAWSGSGFGGVALRTVADDKYVLSKSKESSGGMLTYSFSADELTPFAGQKCTLDYVDFNKGGWGWTYADDITIPGRGVQLSLSANVPVITLGIAGSATTATLGIPAGANTDKAVTVYLTNNNPAVIKLNGSSSPVVEVTFAQLASRSTNLTIVGLTPGTAVINAGTAPADNLDGASLQITVNPGATLMYLFDNGGAITNYGWQVMTTPRVPTSEQSEQYFELMPPFPSAPDGTPNTTPQGGSAGFIGIHVCFFFDNNNGYYWDSPHTTAWIRSPEFKLDGSGDLLFSLAGGGAGSAVGLSTADIALESGGGGFMGVALRAADTDQFVLSAVKPSGGNEWSIGKFTREQLATLDQNARYTLDFIDAFHGGWGWVNLDTVMIPGVLVTPIAQPSLTVQPWTGGRVRISWPAPATGYSLQSSATVAVGYASAELTVTTEGTDLVAYAPVDGGARYFRLAK